MTTNPAYASRSNHAHTVNGSIGDHAGGRQMIQEIPVTSARSGYQNPPHLPPITRGDCVETRAVARFLSSAFYRVPPTVWMVPDETIRLDVIERHMALIVQEGFVHGHVDTIRDETGFVGVAVWIYRRQPRWEPLGHDASARLRAAVGRHYERFSMFEDAIAERRPKFPHDELALLATRQDKQGQGVATRLLTSHCESLDIASLPAVLDASSWDNVRFYQRASFGLLGDPISLPRGPQLWPMLREPRIHRPD